jgi:hypothetical protein
MTELRSADDSNDALVRAVAVGATVEPQLREAPVMSEGTWVGLDVHARSVVAGVSLPRFR